MKEMKVVYTDVTDMDPTPGMDLLRENGFEVRLLELDCPVEELEREISRADAVVCGYRRISEEVLTRSPALKIVATLSVGFDMVDVEAATRLGIQVCNVPPLASEEVATHTLALMLAQERHLERGARIVRNGEWDALKYGAPRRLSELTLGVVGFGRIGRRFAAIASPLFAQTLVYDPFVTDDEQLNGAHSRSLRDVLSNSDVISLHLPLTPESHHIIGREEIAGMKRGVGILNVSRGALIDSGALVDALDSGQIGYTGLDVTDPEPMAPDASLRHSERALITPHVAFASSVTLAGYALAPAKEIIAHFAGQPQISPVNTIRSAAARA